MKLCVVGAGYVGLTTAAVLSELGHTVYCMDLDDGKVQRLNRGIVPIYEPGLDEMIRRNAERNSLFFDTDIIGAMKQCPVIIIAVGTPSAKDGRADMVYLNGVLDELCQAIESHKTIIVKSTVPPGTSDWLERVLIERGVPEGRFDIVMNPEFLREGTAIHDTIHPDRIVIGAKSEAAALTVKNLYASIQTVFLLTDRTGAEMIKYASNAFLATKISFINEISRICEAYGTDVMNVAAGIGLDTRIGSRFLQAGLGYGGSCLPKDVRALNHAADTKKVKLKLLEAVEQINRSQVDVYMNKLFQTLGNSSDKRTIAVLGATFKENTDDIRYSQAIALMDKLVRKGCHVHAYDPIVSPKLLSVDWYETPYDAVNGADAVVIATNWGEFAQLDWNKIRDLMAGDIVLDGRNGIDKSSIEMTGLRYVGVGRG
ncbi:UDP-glucose dehydrogenase family protein [Paenibacillus beijingensis]|uniref:UDP-glucose 6-dehydrogenase n=1 Tax=Paenibacillus beijingensis TaxID=1126833 RepID=A0A0D5NNA7_9BACL|nr:UDP-glucose/GDP-mannose dehydrogenase family protein [Paenibacillus beijingensis]AJY76751.1 UDP-glucose 6-dehydrogenase [Paenibacillus beijingensis]